MAQEATGFIYHGYNLELDPGMKDGDNSSESTMWVPSKTWSQKIVRS